MNVVVKYLSEIPEGLLGIVSRSQRTVAFQEHLGMSGGSLKLVVRKLRGSKVGTSRAGLFYEEYCY